MSIQLRAGGRWWLRRLRVCLVACASLVACKFDTSAPETFAVDGGAAAGRKAAAAGAGAATPAADSGSGGSSRTAAPPSANPAGPTRQGNAPANAPTDDDAGRAPAVDPEQPIDDTECAFEFSACLLANPLDYAACARTNADHCDLLGVNGMSTTAADGGAQPSAACSLQLADCVMRMPAQAQACMDMLATCTL